MFTTLVIRYKKLVIRHVEIQEEEARAKIRYESLVADRKKIEHDMVKLEAALEFGESLMATAPTPSGTALPVPNGDGPPDSIKALILLIPRDGEASRKEFLTELGLATGTLNSRLMDAKKQGYIESAGRGLYKLTDKGKAVHGLRLVTGGA